MKIGETIHNLRKDQGFSQGSFALLVGISATSLSQIENNVTFPKQSTLQEICKKLNISTQILYILSFRVEDIPAENKGKSRIMLPLVKVLMLELFENNNENTPD